MTIIALLKEKGLSRYSLSKKSGVPWATLSDICSGKTSLSRCNAQTV
ncbi:MAG: helix-turn-helix transcriptional regulator, partial [Lachnospiraceae bacterium]